MVGDWCLTGGGMGYTNIHEPIHEYSVQIKYTKYTRASQEPPRVLMSLAEHLHRVFQHGQLDFLFPLFFFLVFVHNQTIDHNQTVCQTTDLIRWFV